MGKQNTERQHNTNEFVGYGKFGIQNRALLNKRLDGHNKQTNKPLNSLYPYRKSSAYVSHETIENKIPWL